MPRTFFAAAIFFSRFPSESLYSTDMATIGQRNTLFIIRTAPPGAYLEGGALGEILLPYRYVHPGAAPGDEVDVFVYLDSEDRLVATTEVPHAAVGEFSGFKVLSVNPRVGAFLDWGLSKDLLLPFREQKTPVRVGQKVIAYVLLDEETNRIVATTKLNKYLDRRLPTYRDGQPVNFLVMDKTPLGYNVIVENAHRALLYGDKVARPLELGEKLRGFIRTVRPDGKIDVDLDASGYKRVLPIKEKIVEMLNESDGKLPFDDNSSPEAIRAKFGVSKKVFKQALGALYKQRRIGFTNPGVELLKETDWSAGD
jgi:predicted RNA-binding protein (virulence factor B family)